MNNFILRNTLLSLSTALLLGITGCSSGGSSDDPVAQAASKAYNGIGIDGILVGSTVCVDGNPTNNKCDVGEPSAITDDKGQFSIPATTVTGPLLLVGGIDNSTGAAFTGSLKAPAGSTVVTPLTSAIQSLVEDGESADDAEANVKAAMGLTNVDVNLTSFDPYNEVSANAQAVLAKQTQLQVLVHSATVTVAGADAGTDVNSTMSSVFDAIVGNFKGATAEVELDAATVSAATKAAADTVYADDQAARVAAKVVAQTSAENSVRDADNAEGAISDGTPAQAAGNLDSAIAKANTTAEVELRAAAQAAKIKSQELLDANADALDEIEALQKAQQEKEAEIAAAKAAQAKAEADLATAQAAAEADTADRVKYEAFLAAQAEAEKAAKDKALADLAVAQAQIAAAQAESSIAAEAAERQAAAEAAEAQAQAEADAAQLRQDAADAAALAASDQAKTLAEAQAAVLVAQQSASLGIAQAQVNTNVQVANFFAMQATQDANATRTLANLAVTGTLADANATAAENARDAALQAASDANVTIVAIDDINTSLATSLGHKNEAQAQAVLAAAALGDAYKVKSDAELAAAAQVALQVKIARIVAIVADVNDTKNTAQTLYDVNTTEIGNSISSAMTAIGTIASNPLYSAAIVKFTDANASAQIVLKAYTDAGASIVLVQQAYSDASSALSDVNETAATQAKDVADAEKAKLDGYLAIGYAQVDVIERLLKEAQAIKTAVDNTPVTPTTTLKLSDISQFHEVNIDDDGVSHYTIAFSNNDIVVSKQELNSDGTFVDAVSSGGDLVLTDSGWVNDTSFNGYTFNSDGTVATFTDGGQVMLVSAVDLSTPEAADLVSAVNDVIPGNIDTSFVSGDFAYFLAMKNVEAYKLWWTPTDCQDWNQTTNSCNVAETTYDTLAVYVNSGNAPLGIESQDGWIPIGFDNTNPIEITSTSTGTLILDRNSSNIVGSWEVITLPYSAGLAIVLSAGEGYEQYMDDDNLIAVADGKVYRGGHELATGTFIPGDEPKFNQAAFDEIARVIKANMDTPSSTFDLSAYLVGTTKYYINDDGTPAQYTFETNSTINGFDADGPYSGLTYTISDNNLTFIAPSGTYIFKHFAATYDGKGQMFEFYNAGTGDYLGEAVFYANKADRDAEMSGETPTTKSFSIDVEKLTITSTTWTSQDLILDGSGALVADPNSSAKTEVIAVSGDTINLNNGEATVKYLGTVSAVDFNSLYGSAFTSAATIHKVAYIKNVESVDSWGEEVQDWTSGSQSSFTSLEALISTYNGTNGVIYSNDGFTDGGLAFGANETLIIVSSTGAVVNSNAGTYSIETTTDGRVIKTVPSYTGYEVKDYYRAFEEKDSKVYWADWSPAGNGGIFYQFDVVAQQEFLTWFNANSSTITDEMNFGTPKVNWQSEFGALTAVSPSTYVALGTLYFLEVQENYSESTSSE